ncbi:MAG: transposase DNA-binding-containing protein [Acidobacteriota bacterium]
MIEEILAKEEEHADELTDLLFAIEPETGEVTQRLYFKDEIPGTSVLSLPKFDQLSGNKDNDNKKQGERKDKMMRKEDPERWADINFSGAEMTDVRRTERVIKIAQAMATNPGASIPQLFERTYDVKATYNFFKHQEATPDNLQAGHRELVLTEMEESGVYLLLEDTTELSWSGKKPITGLGPIGKGQAGQQGFHLHSTLAVRWTQEGEIAGGYRPTVEVIGFCDQQYYIRKPRPKDEGDEDSHKRKRRARESQLWEKASE